MNYDQWKATEPIDYPSAEEIAQFKRDKRMTPPTKERDWDDYWGVKVRIEAIHRAEMEALAMLRKLHDDEAGFLERTPAEIANDLESYRCDRSAGEGWDDALQGLADTIAFCAWAVDMWMNDWMLALKAAISEDYEIANGILGRISWQMTEIGNQSECWEHYQHDKIGGR